MAAVNIMDSANKARQQIPLRPLFVRAVDEAPSNFDKPRRVTLPAPLLLHHKSATYDSRVEKHPPSSRKRRGRASPGLDQQFADAIEDTRNEIRKAADEVLARVEHDANVELAEVVDDFEEKLQLAIDYETRAFQSIADERLLITTLSPGKKPLKKEEVVFGERMKEFEHTVRDEEIAIEALWREWKKVQIETICLALEVLGPSEVVVEEGAAVVAPQRVAAAVQCYSQRGDALKVALEKLTAVQSSAKKVVSRTLKTLKDQQEELSAANIAAMNNVAQMLQELDA